MRSGFTLMEVVVALLVLEVVTVGAVGIVALASERMSRAERIERALATAEGILDSLSGMRGVVDGAVVFPGGDVRWTRGTGSNLVVTAMGAVGDTLFDVETVLPLP